VRPLETLVWWAGTGERISSSYKALVLELVEALGNVSKACRRRGLSRPQFYEYKRRRFQTHGVKELLELPPVHKSHPRTTPAEVQGKNLESTDNRKDLDASA
jgi:hypothetical protein